VALEKKSRLMESEGGVSRGEGERETSEPANRTFLRKGSSGKGKRRPLQQEKAIPGKSPARAKRQKRTWAKKKEWDRLSIGKWERRLVGWKKFPPISPDVVLATRKKQRAHEKELSTPWEGGGGERKGGY